MLAIKDTALFYLEGYIHAKVPEPLLQGKVPSSDFDKVKKDSCGMYERLYFSVVMLGVADKDSFKTLIARTRTKDELQRDAYHRIPNLKEGLSYNKVCSLR